MAIEKGQRRIIDQEGAEVRAISSGAAGLWGLVRSPLVLGLVVFVLALLPRVLDLDVFVGPDEFLWLTRTAEFAQGVTAGDFSKSYQTGHPGVMLMWIETVGAWLRYGVAALSGPVDWITITGPDKTMATLAAKRQVIGLANAGLVALAALLSWRLFGAPVAWLAGLLLAFDPFLLAESRVLRPEGTVTGFTLLALLGLLLYLKREGRPGYSALAGALTGLALLSKVSAAVLLPVGLLAIGGLPLLDRTRPLAQRGRAALLRLVVWGGALLLTVLLLWPALWVAPLEVAQKLYGYSAERTVDGESSGGDAFFLGTTRPHAELGPLFYPLVLLYRSSPLVWLGLLALAVTLFHWRGRLLSRRSELGLGLLLLLYLAGYLALIAGSTLKFDRYVIPMMPVLSLLAAIGLVAGWRWLAAQWPRLAGWGWLAGLVLLAGQMALALPHHPYYYTYWNPLLGGPRQAVNVLPIGVGEGMEQVVNYLNSLPDAEEVLLASGSAQQISSVLQGKHIPLTNLVGEWFLADYTFIYIAQYQRDKYDPNILAYLQRNPPVLTVTLHGLDYGWLYRGPGAEFFGGDTKLEGRATLHAYDLSATALTAGQALAVTLYFRNEGQQPADRFYVRLVDDAGYVWSEGTVQPRPGFEEAARTANAFVEGEAELALPVGMPPGEYLLKLGYENQALGELVGEFVLPADAPRLAVSAAQGAPVEAVKPQVRLDRAIDERLELLGYGLEQAEVVPGEAPWLSLYWRALVDIERDYAMAVQLLDGDGEEAAYWLGRPVHSGYGTEQWQAGQVVQDPWRLEIPAETAPGDYRLRLVVFDSATANEVGQVELGPVGVVKRRQRFDAPEMQQPLQVKLGAQMTLLGYDLNAEPLPGGGRLRVTLYWQGLETIDRSYTVFVQLLSPEGVLVAQHDGLPVEGRAPTTEWAQGEVIVDRHLVEFGPLEAGTYRLVTGMYDGETGERLMLADGADFVLLQELPIEGRR